MYKNVKSLPQETIIQLFRQYKTTHDKQYRDQIILANIRLVQHYVKTIVKQSADFEDICQEGILGLFDAVEKYQLTEQTKFSTYAWWWITKYVHEYFEKNQFPYAVPRHAHRMYIQVKHFYTEYTKTYAVEPDIEILMEQFPSYTANALQTALNMLQTSYTSLDAPCNVSSQDITLLSRIPDDQNNIDQFLESEHNGCLRQYVKEILSDREYDVIALRYGLYDEEPWTLQKISMLYHISRERIRQIENKALEKLSRSPKIRALR